MYEFLRFIAVVKCTLIYIIVKFLMVNVYGGGKRWVVLGL